MDIGTAKPTADERRRVPHHALDLVRPDEAVPRRALGRGRARRDRRHRRARPAADRRRRDRPLLPRAGHRPVRGAAARRGHPRRATARRPRPTASRRCTRGWPRVDPEAAAAIRARDLVRISRALEVHEQTGVPITTLRRRAAPPADLAPTVLLLDPPLATLRARIAARVEQMIAAGFLDEVRALRAAGYGPALKPLQALGYRQLGAVLDGTASLADAVAETIAGHVRLRAPAADLVPQAGRRPPLRGRPRIEEALRRARAASMTVPGCVFCAIAAGDDPGFDGAARRRRRGVPRRAPGVQGPRAGRAARSRPDAVRRAGGRSSARCSPPSSASRAPSRPAWAPTAPSSR